LAYSPDGKRLACASREGPVAKVWDAQTGQELVTLKESTGVVSTLAVGPRPAPLGPGTIPIGKLDSLAFSPDGNRLISSIGGGRVMVWDATPLPEKR
jgi:WD40 repeat protein